MAINITDSTITYNDAAYNGEIGFPSLTNNQAWTFPNATGTIALTSDIIPYTLQQVLNTGYVASDAAGGINNFILKIEFSIKY
mgnify:CR=1 FL=1